MEQVAAVAGESPAEGGFPDLPDPITVDRAARRAR